MLEFFIYPKETTTLDWYFFVYSLFLTFSIGFYTITFGAEIIAKTLKKNFFNKLALQSSRVGLIFLIFTIITSPFLRDVAIILLSPKNDLAYFLLYNLSSYSFLSFLLAFCFAILSSVSLLKISQNSYKHIIFTLLTLCFVLLPDAFFFFTHLTTYFEGHAFYFQGLIGSVLFMLIFLVLRRSMDNFGRDYYIVIPKFLASIALTFILAYFVAVMLLYFATDSPFILSSDAFYPIHTKHFLLFSLFTLITVASCLLLTVLATYPMRYKPLAFTAFLLFLLMLPFTLPLFSERKISAFTGAEITIEQNYTSSEKTLANNGELTKDKRIDNILEKKTQEVK